MELSLVARPLVRVLLMEVAPQLFACRVCESTVENDILAVLDHYWREHPLAVTLGLAGTIGVLALAGAGTRPRGRR